MKDFVYRIYAYTTNPTVLVAIAVVGSLALVGMTTGSAATATGSADLPTLLVDTMRVAQQPAYEVRRSFVGRVEAARESDVGFELAGQVAELLFDEGQQVRRGQSIARLDTARLEARRNELAAALDEARANLELAELTRDRFREALDLNAVSSQQWDEAEKNYQAHLAAVRRSDSALRAIEVDITKSELQAPFDALVAKRSVDEGEVVPAGQPVFTLLERTNPEARIGIAGDAVGAIEPGQQYEVIVGDRRISATVKAVLPVRDNGTRSVDVILVLDTQLNGIRSGDLANLELVQTIAEPGFWLPLGALTESSRGLWAVYVAQPISSLRSGADPVGVRNGISVARPGANPTHRVERRELELLHQEAERVFVRGTLQPRDLVVAGGLHRLVPGQEIRVAGADISEEMVR